MGIRTRSYGWSGRKATIFKGETGEALFGTEAGPVMSGLHHFQTLIATKDRIFVGADGRIYAFVF